MEATPAGWRLRLFGPPRVTTPSAVVRPLGDKAACLGVLLCLQPQLSREEAAVRLWPDTPAAVALANLRVLIHRVHALTEVPLFSGRGQLALAPGWTADLAEIVGGLASDALLARSLRVPLLAGIHLARLREMARLVEYEALRLREQAIESLVQRARFALKTEPARTRMITEWLIRADAIDDTVLSLRVQAAEAVGQPQEAVDTLRRVAAAAAAGACSLDACTRLGALRAAADAACARHVPTPRPPPGTLLDRKAVLAQLQAVRDRGGLALLIGEPGAGKSSVLAHLAGDPVPGATLLVRADHPSRSEQLHLAWLAHAQSLLGGSPDDIDDLLPGLVRLARGAAASAGDTGSRSAPVPEVSGEELVREAQRLLDLLHALGLRTLVVDDLHKLDPASIALLQHLIDRHPAAGLHGTAPATATGMALLLAGRTDEIPAAIDQRLRGDRSGCTVATLAPLSLRAVQALLKRQGRPGSTDLSANRVLALTQGNPFLVQELVRCPEIAEQLPGAQAVQPTATEVLSARIGLLDPHDRALLEVVSLSRQVLSPAQLQALTGLTAMEIDQRWRRLVPLGLLAREAVTVAHDLVLDAVLQQIPATTATHWHGRLADRLEHDGAPRAVVHAHRLLARDGPRILSSALAYCHHLLGQGQWQRAREVIQDALETVGDAEVPGRFEAWQLAHYIQLNRSDLAAAKRSGAAMQRTARDDAQADLAACATAVVYEFLGDAASGLAVIEDRMGPGRRSSPVDTLAKAVHGRLLAVAGHRQAARALLGEVAQAHDLFQALDGLEFGSAAFAVARGLALCGETDRSLELCQQLARQAAREGQHLSECVTAISSVTLAIADSAMRHATEFAERAWRVSTLHGFSSDLQDRAAFALMRVLVMDGDLARAWTLETTHRWSAEPGPDGVLFLANRAALRHALGQPDEARRLWEAADDRLSDDHWLCDMVACSCLALEPDPPARLLRRAAALLDRSDPRTEEPSVRRLRTVMVLHRPADDALEQLDDIAQAAGQQARPETTRRWVRLAQVRLLSLAGQHEAATTLGRALADELTLGCRFADLPLTHALDVLRAAFARSSPPDEQALLATWAAWFVRIDRGLPAVVRGDFRRRYAPWLAADRVNDDTRRPEPVTTL